jgi:hypothetical protein
MKRGEEVEIRYLIRFPDRSVRIVDLITEIQAH